MEGKRLTSYAMEELECPKCGHKHSLKKKNTKIKRRNYEEQAVPV